MGINTHLFIVIKYYSQILFNNRYTCEYITG